MVQGARLDFGNERQRDLVVKLALNLEALGGMLVLLLLMLVRSIMIISWTRVVQLHGRLLHAAHGM